MVEVNKRSLTIQEQAELQEKRSLIEQLLASEAAEHHTAAEKLTLLKLLFEKKVFNCDQHYRIDCMGVLLGDALCQVLGLEWVVVGMEDGDEFAVSFPGVQVFCSPLSVIHKRILRGEDVDVFYLFVGIAETMTRELRSRKYKVDQA